MAGTSDRRSYLNSGVNMMGEDHPAVVSGEGEPPGFKPWGDGHALMEFVAFRSWLRADRGPGSGTLRGAGLRLESQGAAGYEYQLVFLEEDLRALHREAAAILARYD